MVQASVGFHCPDCASSSAAASPTITTGTLARGRPLVTLSLIALNVGFFLADLATARGASLLSQGSGDLSRWGLLVGFGTFDGQTASGVAAGEWWRILTGGFLHAGLLHLGMNMLVLWLLGSQLEPLLGRARFLALYITGLVAGALGVLLVSPTSATVGASGAVFALMGASFAAQRAWGLDPWRSGIGTLILVNVVITFAVPGISIGGHLGGLVGGVLAGFLVVQVDRRARSAAYGVAVCAVLTAVFWVGCLWAADQWRDPVLGFLNFSFR
jgi:membrane associated rhomboid family serine protease